MSIIQVSCIDQVMTMTNTPVISSGGVREDSVSFSFCPLWDGYYKTAVFWRTEDDAYHVVLDDTNSCVIPDEVLMTDGALFFGVFGVNDAGDRRTSDVLRYTIVKGAITDGTKPSEPTQDMYTQLLAAVAALGDNKGKADKVESVTAGHLAGLDANGNLTDSGKKPDDFVLMADKGAAGGVPTLDENGTIPPEQLPDEYVPTSEKGQPAGVATLDGDGKVPVDQLPSMDYVPNTEKGQPAGVATLDEDGKVPVEQLPTFGSRTVWFFPFSYPNVTTFDRSTGEGTDGSAWRYFYFQLPEEIDCSKYYYEFVGSVYGAIRYGATTNSTCVELKLMIKDDTKSKDLMSFGPTSDYSTGQTEHITFPAKCSKTVEMMHSTYALYTIIEGYVNGKLISDMNYLIGSTLDALGSNVYDRVRVGFQVGYASNPCPIETFGVKLEYRALGRKV